MLSVAKKRMSCKVLETQMLSPSAAIVRFERHGLEFEPGQYIRVGIDGDEEIRDYSVYSGVNDDFLQVLVRRVEGGLVSKQLCDVVTGDVLSVGGPYGHFKLTDEVKSRPVFLIATGTGISPYHSFATSYPNLDFKLIHGTAKVEEAYESDFYGERYIHCVSQEEGGDFKGRVTDYLQTLGIPEGTNAFLCGNCDMIYEAFDLLQSKGLKTSQIHTEVYF